tara:strand:- start:9343 stop:10296 length:954 start_codon:yes stop_codon:yes gene_type:complete
MNILLIDQVAKSEYAKKYLYYNGLLAGLELTSGHDIYFTNKTVINVDELEEATGLKFDYVIYGLGWFGSSNYFGEVKCTNAKKIVHLFKPQNDLDRKLSFCKRNNVDFIITPLPEYKDIEAQTGIKTLLFPYGYYPHLFKQRHDIPKIYDIGFSGALHQNKLYPEGEFPSQNLRLEIKKQLDEIEDVEVFWKSSDKFETARIHDNEEYAKTINRSKIWIATNASHGDVTPRYYEILGSGTLLFCEEIHESYKSVLKDGYNCVSFKTDLSDFKEKLRFYINNDTERNRIVNNALADSVQKFTWFARASKLLEDIGENK